MEENLDHARMDAEYAEAMASFRDMDEETGHMSADGLLCDLLKELGFTRTVEEFEKLNKWYS